MAKENKVFQETRPLLAEKFGEVQAQKIMLLAEQHYQKLLDENPNEPKEMHAQTAFNIYPCISLYRAMQEENIKKEDAFAFLDWSYSLRAKKNADSMQKLFKLPGLYKLYPAMFKSVAQKQFGEKAGFTATFYDMGKGRTKFDMTGCLYCDICAREHCREIVPCFCHTDDVNNANLHPKLCWNRTTIMGDGGEKCDFDIFVKS